MTSKWSKGVDSYAKELKAQFKETYGNQPMTEEKLLNGAQNWKQYSYGGNSEIYDQNIANRLATPSEIKRVTRKDGSLGNPNPNEQWLDTQARALQQAAWKLTRK